MKIFADLWQLATILTVGYTCACMHMLHVHVGKMGSGVKDDLKPSEL